MYTVSMHSVCMVKVASHKSYSLSTPPTGSHAEFHPIMQNYKSLCCLVSTVNIANFVIAEVVCDRQRWTRDSWSM